MVETEVDPFGLLVQAHAGDAFFPPEAAFLETTERRRDGKLLVGIDPYRAGRRSAWAWVVRRGASVAWSCQRVSWREFDVADYLLN
jgi:hypothetical protein